MLVEFRLQVFDGFVYLFFKSFLILKSCMLNLNMFLQSFNLQTQLLKLSLSIKFIRFNLNVELMMLLVYVIEHCPLFDSRNVKVFSFLWNGIWYFLFWIVIRVFFAIVSCLECCCFDWFGQVIVFSWFTYIFQLHKLPIEYSSL